MTKKHLRVAMLGSGNMAASHAKRLLNIEAVEITAVCGRTIEGAEAFRENMRLPDIAAFDDFDRMLAADEFDILYITLPPFAHDGQFEKAVTAGKHVYIEKPIALTTERGASMVAAAQAAGVVTHVGYHNRFGSAVEYLMAELASGAAGKPLLFDARYDCNSLHTPWWRDKTKSGGQIFEQLIHTYDLSMVFLGQPLTVSVIMDRLTHADIEDYTVEDNSSGQIRFSDGGIASICGSNSAVPSEWNHQFTLICSKLTAYFSSPNRAEFVYTEGSEVKRINHESDRDLYAASNQAFINAVRGDCDAVCTIEDGFASLKLVERAVASADLAGQMVRYND